jgi:hypothetical protein
MTSAGPRLDFEVAPKHIRILCLWGGVQSFATLWGLGGGVPGHLPAVCTPLVCAHTIYVTPVGWSAVRILSWFHFAWQAYTQIGHAIFTDVPSSVYEVVRKAQSVPADGVRSGCI